MRVTMTIDVRRGDKDTQVALTEPEPGVVEVYLAPIERQASATFRVPLSELEEALDTMKRMRRPEEEDGMETERTP